jgi:transcription elongation factor GreA
MGVNLFMNPRLDAYRTDFISQLLYFDEEFSEELSRTSVGLAEKNKVISLAEQYCAQLDHLLKQGEQILQSAPRVLIGSKVTIRYEPDQDEDSYVLVLPNFSNIDDGHISFLSPLGMNLLLGQVGDLVEVNSPAGMYQVRIIKIE